MGIDAGLGVGVGLVKGTGGAGPTDLGWGVAGAAATAPPPPRAGGGQLLAGFLQHLVRILAGANHPHHQVVAAGAWVKQQGGVETQPAVDELLIGLHRDGNQVGLLPAAGGLAGAASPTAATANATGATTATPTAAAAATAAIGERFGSERLGSSGFKAGGLREIGATAATAATPAAAAGGIGRGHRACHLGPGRSGGAHQTRGGGQG